MTEKNKISDLRQILFDQLNALKNGACDLTKETNRASAMVQIASSILESAKVETEFLKVINEFQQNPTLGTGFIEIGDKKTLPSVSD